MKVFERTSDSGWGNRLNVVDENNVVVGFDYDSSCCENFGHVFLTGIPAKVDGDELTSIEFDHTKFVFDTTFFKDNLGLCKYDSGGACAFRLTNKEGAEVFLILYNHHSGYYAHGFDMEVGGKKLYKGSL